MAWYRNPARLWLVIGLLAAALGGQLLIARARQQPPKEAPARLVRTVGVTSEGCRRAVEAGEKVALAAGTALYVAPDFPGLVREALDAPTGDDRRNVLARLRAASSGLRKARSLSESGDPPAWWRFQKWSALCLGEPVASATYKPPIGNADDAGRTVRRFMEARLRGRGAEYFVSANGEDEFGRAGGLAPLYPKPVPKDFDIVFVDNLGDGSYEVGVELAVARGRYGDTLFVVFNGFRYRITGGRPGLEGP